MDLSTLISFCLSSTTMMRVATTVNAATMLISASTPLIAYCWISNAVNRPWFSSIQSIVWYMPLASSLAIRSLMAEASAMSRTFISTPVTVSPWS